MSLHITAHAIDRAIEHIPGITNEAQAIAALDTLVVQKAAEFCGNAQIHVRIPTGQRIVAQCGTVITVMAPQKTFRAARLRDRHKAALVEE